MTDPRIYAMRLRQSWAEQFARSRAAASMGESK